MDNTTNRNPVILDCDTGEDDALAILVAIANKLPLKYIFSSYGNTTIENSTRNSSRLLSLANKKDIQVVEGITKPLHKHPHEKEMTAGDFVGKNGICNARLPKSQYKNIISFPEKTRVRDMAQLLQDTGPVDYIITGPCTNFAHLCKELGPEIKKYVSSLYIMGGAVHADGNSGPQHPKTGKSSAEFNFYCDPHAADITIHSGIPIYLVTWDITSQMTIPNEKLIKYKSDTATGKFVLHLGRCFFKYYGFKNYRNFELNDPVTIAAYLGYGTYEEKKLRIITRGIHYGRSIEDKDGAPVQYYVLSNGQKDTVIKKLLDDLSIQIP